MLLILAEEDKPRTAEDVDRFVATNTPDRDAELKLHRLVEAHMVHGPCGHLNPLCP